MVLTVCNRAKGYMRQFKVIVKVGGVWATTIVFADNSAMAFKLVQQQFGATNVLAPPMQLH